MNKSKYRELQMRLKENRELGRGGLGRWGFGRVVAQGLAVQPWRVIIPIAVAVTLLGWLINKNSLTRVILRIFSGL